MVESWEGAKVVGEREGDREAEEELKVECSDAGAGSEEEEVPEEDDT